MIEEAYVSFETAKLLVRKGFNHSHCHCESYYTIKGEVVYWKDKPNVLNVAPRFTLAMAMRWLREVHNIIVEPNPVWSGKKWEYQLFIVTPQNAASPYYEHNLYKSYEECVEAAIKYCLENLI